MKAAVLHELGQPLAIEELPQPSPRKGEAVIKVEACGVCHSDLHLAAGDWPDAIARRVRPTVLGHEVVGRIVEVGSETQNLRVGDRVGVGWLCSTCGTCEPCREGDENICVDRQITGIEIPGGYAEYMRAPASHMVAVPDDLPPAEAAPFFCAGVTVYRAVKKAAIQRGFRVGIFGVGGLGHLAIQCAAHAGADPVAVDLTPDKLDLARTLGATQAFLANGAHEQIQAQGGLHVAVVTAASKAAYDLALRSLRKKGTLIVVGLPKEDLTFFADDFVMGEFRIIGSAVGTRQDIREVLALAATGKVRCQTQPVKLEEINAVLDSMRNGAITGRVAVCF